MCVPYGSLLHWLAQVPTKVVQMLMRKQPPSKREYVFFLSKCCVVVCTARVNLGSDLLSGVQCARLRHCNMDGADVYQSDKGA